MDTLIQDHKTILIRVIWGVCTLILLSVFTAVLIRIIDFQASPAFGSLLPQETILAGLVEFGISPELYKSLHITRVLFFVIVSIVTGILIFLRKPGEWVTLYFSLVLIAIGVVFEMDILPPVEAIHPFYSLLINGAFAAIFFSFYIFPDGRFVPRWTRWLVLVWLAMSLSTSLAPGSFLDPNSWPQAISAVYFLLLFLSCPGALIYRYVSNRDFTQRQQIKWVTLGVTVAVVSFLVFWLPFNLFLSLFENAQNAVLYDLVGGTIFAVAFATLPIAINFALLRYRLWDIDPLVNRTIVYASLTVITILLYVTMVVVLGNLFQAQGNPLFAFIATGFIAVIFQPLRVRIQWIVNRLMYGERDDPYAVISHLGRQLEAALSPETVLPTLVETVKDALRLPFVAITLKQDHEEIDRASAGDPVENTFTLPLIYQNETVGELILAPRSPGEPFNPADQGLLENLVRQAGTAAYSLRLTAELQHARQHLVVAREEERRRLRRDLHDGLGPHLASQSLTITAARQLLHKEPEAADVLLEKAIQHAQTAVNDIRRVVYDLRPPALDDLGLEGALRAQAKDYSSHEIQINIDIPKTLPQLSAAVEVACYRIAQEALTNVICHANATECTLRIKLNKHLRLEVLDNGCGIPSNYRSGVGLNSMRTRAEELGGSFRIEAAREGGTQMIAELPL